MLINYLKISFRKFTKQKFYSLLNIFGLATGMATVLLIMLYLVDEASYDKFHQKADQLYRVVEHHYYAGKPVMPVAVTPGPLAPSLKEQFPEVLLASRTSSTRATFQMTDHWVEDEGIFVDQDFLQMFSFAAKSGSASSALKDLNSIVITESLAIKLFGNSDGVGKTVKLTDGRDLIVTAVLYDVPANSHIQFNFLRPMEFLLSLTQSFDSWGNHNIYTYVELNNGADKNVLDKKIKKHLLKMNDDKQVELSLQSVTDIYLDETSFVADVSVKGNIQYVRIFTLVAGFILIIACINFMNLSTARSMKRAKEVGLRKTVGAYRYQLVFQFLGESIMVAIVSVVIALLMVDLMLTPFNTLTQKTLELNLESNLLPITFAATLLTGALAGTYPALYLSAFNPARVLKGTITTASSSGTFRKILVVLQFCISIIMISGTLVISSQISFIKNKNLGYQKEQIINIQRLSHQYEVLKRNLLAYPQIKGVGAANQHPANVMSAVNSYNWPGKPEESGLIHNFGVDNSYIETMKIELLQGRTFAKDKSDTASIILNEEALKVMSLKDAIGQKILYNDKERTIIGVVKNFHFKSFHDKIEPLVMYLEHESAYSLTMVHIEGDLQATLKTVEQEWKKLNPDQEMVYSFLDEDFDNLYKAESQTGTIFTFFSTLAILISCLGLFGLASYTVEQKSKEFGIRKVFGASVGRLFYTASKDFMVLVIIAFAISLPITWWWMSEWLSGFAYHTPLSWSFFLVAGITGIVVALITVSYQSLKVAFINPAKTLKSE